MIKTSIILLLVLGTVNFIAYSQDSWERYNYDSYHFKIDFFEKPVFSVDSSAFSDSGVVSSYWQLKVSDTLHQNKFYSISVSDYPSDYIHSDSLLSVVEGFINSSQADLFEDKAYTLLSSSITEKQGYPGKAYRWKYNSNDRFLEYQVFLVESRLFVLSVVSWEGEAYNIYINKFFDSFEITTIPNGKFTLPKSANKRTIEINFPSKPMEQLKMVDTEHGKMFADIQSYEPTIKEDNMVYIAMETKYPPNVIDQNNTYELNGFYKKSIDASLNATNGELISINDIYYKGNLGKEYKSYLAEGKVLSVYRCYFIHDSFYIMGVMTSPEKDKNKEMKNFFESFKIRE